MARKNYSLRILFLMMLLSSQDFDALGQSRNSGHLTGTWSLDASRSDDVRDATNRALGDSGANTDRIRQQLETRLQPPDRLAIEQNGRRITMVSSSAPRVIFDADGRSRSETNANGRSVRTTASLSGSVLTVRTQGDRSSDYLVIFEPVESGRSLQVTRRMHNDRLAQPIETRSFYTRVSNVAQLDETYSSDQSISASRRNRPSGDTGVPADVTLVATLNESLNTKTSQDRDRFTVTVRSPSQYEGAVIDEYLTRVERSGRATGSPEIGFEFQTIRLRNGQSYDFSGYIDQVRTPTGDKVTVDNEGSVKEKSGQTQRTAVRSGMVPPLERLSEEFLEEVRALPSALPWVPARELDPSFCRDGMISNWKVAPN
jgi:hypothetical protein